LIYEPKNFSVRRKERERILERREKERKNKREEIEREKE
jgi:hypothetical protein